jgi:hypothetical protein
LFLALSSWHFVAIFKLSMFIKNLARAQKSVARCCWKCSCREGPRAPFYQNYPPSLGQLAHPGYNVNPGVIPPPPPI